MFLLEGSTEKVSSCTGEEKKTIKKKKHSSFSSILLKNLDEKQEAVL